MLVRNIGFHLPDNTVSQIVPPSEHSLVRKPETLVNEYRHLVSVAWHWVVPFPPWLCGQDFVTRKAVLQ